MYCEEIVHVYPPIGNINIKTVEVKDIDRLAAVPYLAGKPCVHVDNSSGVLMS